MKGIILAGGTGSRLHPLTLVTNKHLLPVYNKPMIFHPIDTLARAGIKDIMVTTGCESIGDIMKLLGSGSRFGLHFTYRIQDEAGGIAQALGLCRDFSQDESCAVILGDNIFQDTFDLDLRGYGCKLFLKEVPDANRFGVAYVQNNAILNIEEKPKVPKSNFAVTGLYVYEPSVFDVVKILKPSARGELEITDVNNHYVNGGRASFEIVKGFWSDAGTFPSLLRASNLVEKHTEDKN